MSTQIGISDSNRRAVTKQLAHLLADEFILYTKTRKAHWNVEGPDFHAMHVFLNPSMNNWMKSWTAWPSASANWATIRRPR